MLLHKSLWNADTLSLILEYDVTLQFAIPLHVNPELEMYLGGIVHLSMGASLH